MFEPGNLFPFIALVFALFAISRWLRSGMKVDASVRTWLLLAGIFGAVAWWLNAHLG